MKRSFDVALASLGLLVLWPALAAAAILIKRHDGGPVFYLSNRIGRNGVPFRIFKFRTMVMNADKIGGSSTPEDDPRITPLGRALRRFKLDELPQLINVFVGEMSFVGPRPEVASGVALYTPEQRRLLDVRPGITDFASIRFRNEGEILKGSADPDKDYLEKIAPEKIRLGLEYVRRNSLLLDLRIIFATVWAVAGFDPEKVLDFPRLNA